MKKKLYCKQLEYPCDFFFLSPVDDGEVPLREKEKKVRPFSMLDSVDQSAGPAPCGGLRKNQSSEDILRDAQVRWDGSALHPPRTCPSEERILHEGEQENKPKYICKMRKQNRIW